tara:strand:+ start:3531 stop:4850 length:1320 start_codon:yes stop_codon:yes gene_type:complete
MKKNKTQVPSTRLTKTNKKRFYSLMLNFLGYIGREYSAEYLKTTMKDNSPNYWEVNRKLHKWGAKWMLEQKRKDIIFLLTLDKLNSLSSYHNVYHYSRSTDIKNIINKWGSLDKLTKAVRKKLKTNNYPRVKDSLVDYLEDVVDKYLDTQLVLSAENLYRIAIQGSINYACKLTLNKYINLVVTKSKGLALKRVIECTQVTTTTKYKSLLFSRAKETSDQRLFRLLTRTIGPEQKAELFLYIYDQAVNKYINKPYKLSYENSWYSSDLFPQKLFDVYYNLDYSSSFKSYSDGKRKAIKVIAKDLGKLLFSNDWDNYRFILISKLPYNSLYDIMFSYLSMQPKNKVKGILFGFFSNLLAKKDELFTTEILNNPTIKERNQIGFIKCFLDNDGAYSRNISSDILRDCIALYGKHEDFLYFMSYLNSDHQQEFFVRAESKWK